VFLSQLQSDFDRVAAFSDVEGLRGADLIAVAGAFVDVAAEKIYRLDAIDPLAQGWAAGVFSSCEFVEARAERRKMNDEVERFQVVKRRESFCDFLF